jgi:hypothetical protein
VDSVYFGLIIRDERESLSDWTLSHKVHRFGLIRPAAARRSKLVPPAVGLVALQVPALKSRDSATAEHAIVYSHVSDPAPRFHLAAQLILTYCTDHIQLGYSTIRAPRIKITRALIHCIHELLNELNSSHRNAPPPVPINAGSTGVVASASLAAHHPAQAHHLYSRAPSEAVRVSEAPRCHRRYAG